MNWYKGFGFGGDSIIPGFREVISSLLGQFLGTNATGRDKEIADLTLRNDLASMAQSYKYQEEFYNNYQSYPAQVAQLQEAGINPMAVFGNGGSPGASSAPNGSAGGAGASAAMLPQLLSAFLNYKVQSRQVDVQEELVESQKYRNFGSGASGFATAEEKMALIQYKKDNLQAETAVYRDELNNNEVNRALTRANISKSQADAALSVREAAILAIQEKHGDAYWTTMLDLQEAQTRLAEAQANNQGWEAKLAEQRIKALEVETDNLVKEGIGLVLDNGTKAHEFEIMGVAAGNAERATKLSNTKAVIDMVTGCVDSVSGVVGSVAGLKSAGAAVMTAGASKSRAGSYRDFVDVKNADTEDRMLARQLARERKRSR